MFEPFVMSPSVVLRVKGWISKSQSLPEKVQLCKRCWKTNEFAWPGGFFWRTL